MQFYERRQGIELNCGLSTQQVYPLLEECVVNCCLFPNVCDTQLGTPFQENGVLAATILAVNLRALMLDSSRFPALRNAKSSHLISSPPR
jgi:hypothetical protein